jgi:predicted deacylase
VHRLAEQGLANVLRHAGILEGEVVTRASTGLPDAVILDGRDTRNYLLAPSSGIFETLVDPGDAVRAGQTVGRIHSLEDPEREPEQLLAPLDGVTACVRAISWTSQGDNVLVFGQPIEAAALL